MAKATQKKVVTVVRTTTRHVSTPTKPVQNRCPVCGKYTKKS